VRLARTPLGVAILVGALLFAADARAATTQERVNALERHAVRLDERTEALDDQVAELRRRTTPSFVLGLASGSILAVFGALVTWTVAAWRGKRERPRRDRSVLGVCGAELIGLGSAARENQDTVGTELVALRAGEGASVSPLLPLALPSLQLLWTQPPKPLEDRWDLLARLSTLAAAAQHANDLGQRRDAYLAVEGIPVRHLSKVDEVLHDHLGGVISKATELHRDVTAAT
jgi:hypothetical protein